MTLNIIKNVLAVGRLLSDWFDSIFNLYVLISMIYNIFLFNILTFVILIKCFYCI